MGSIRFNGVLFRIRIFIWVGVLIWTVSAHPQCLDFRAPFYPGRPLEFCTEYRDLGCCDSTNDRRIREEFEQIQRRAPPEDWAVCEEKIKEVLCQKCSPFAAHLYDAEATGEPRDFPGLCTNYCHDFHDRCQNLFQYMAQSVAIFPRISQERFCERHSLSDVDYCYPELKTNPILQRNLTDVKPVPEVDPSSGSCLCLQPMGSKKLANPLWAGHAGDGSGRLFVATQQGKIYIYNTRTTQWNSRTFLDISDVTTHSRFSGDERGFLAVAFHPNYSNNGRLFVYYVLRRETGDVLPPELQGLPGSYQQKTRLSEWKVSSSSPDRVDPTSEKVVLELFQPYANHNGGDLKFGDDGYLYLFGGDGGAAGDPLAAGQNKSLLLAKVLRLDVDSDPSQPYTIPPDNPFIDEPGAKPEIYAYGVRNMWRCGLDRGDRVTQEGKGRIVCGDVGQNRYEEIDLIKKGANYGWNSREGFECYNQDCGNIGPEELPIHAYGHSVGKSVTGGVFYRGCESPALNGMYLFGDYVSSALFSLRESGGDWTHDDVSLCGSLCQGDLVGSMDGRYILSFGEDEDGEIYMLTSESSSAKVCDGQVFKILDPSIRGDPSSCAADLSSEKRVGLPRRHRLMETGIVLLMQMMEMTLKMFGHSVEGES